MAELEGIQVRPWYALSSLMSSRSDITSSSNMLYLLLGIAAVGLAQKEFKALNARANSTEPIDSLLLPRELTGRQLYCDTGYGLCGTTTYVSLSIVRRLTAYRLFILLPAVVE